MRKQNNNIYDKQIRHMINQKTFIYALYEEHKPNIIKYVGKSNNPEKRFKNHIIMSKKLKTYKDRWLQKSIKNNINIKYKILEIVDINVWDIREQYWITFYKTKQLTNTSVGGKGGGSILYKITYEKAKKYVHTLNVKNVKSWYLYLKEIGVPKNIPKNPKEVFLKRGWISWGDFLGNNNIYDNKISEIYISYEKAKLETIKFKCQSIKDWKTLIKNNSIPIYIPNKPYRFYKKRGWISWGDFLGNNNISNIDKKNMCLSYKDAKKWLKKHTDIKTVTAFRKNTKLLPNFIPKNPDKKYKNVWIGWTSFLN